jgi:hypothetical protein
MAITSPRHNFRGQSPVPLDMPDERNHLLLLARAIRHLQESVRQHPRGATTCSATYTMADLDSLILAGASAADITVSLLSAEGREGRQVAVKKTDSSDNLVVIDPAGSETIDGSGTISLVQQHACRLIQSDGANWRLVASVGNATAL